MTTLVQNWRGPVEDFIDVNDKDAISWIDNLYPAITASRPVGMSEGYKFMSSLTIAKTLQNDFGMKLVACGQQRSNQRDPKGQEHFMKFSMPEAVETSFKRVGDSLPELVIMNSHNGRSTIKAFAGIFRFICANGIVVSEESFGKLRMRHFGEKNTFEEFNKLLKVMTLRTKLLAARILKMQGTLLTRHEENQLAKLVMEARKTPDWITAKMLLEVHRPEDDYDEEGVRDLWKTFNVIQENATSRQITLKAKGEDRAKSVRPLTGARSDIVTNEKIWQAMETFISDRAKKFPELQLVNITPKEPAEKAVKKQTEVKELVSK